GPATGDVERPRATMAKVMEPLNADVDTSGVDMEGLEVPGPFEAPLVPVRVYRPSRPASGQPQPALLDIHGGGFVVGNIEMEHAFAVQVARTLEAVVVAVEYRLAPEHPFPTGL